MPDILPPRLFRLLLVEDDLGRVQEFRSWLPSQARLVWAQSAGAALGLIRRDRGHIYGGVLLDYDLNQRTITEEDESLSGSDVTLALIAHFSIDTPILVHSLTSQAYYEVIRRIVQDEGWSVAILVIPVKTSKPRRSHTLFVPDDHPADSTTKRPAARSDRISARAAPSLHSRRY